MDALGQNICRARGSALEKFGSCGTYVSVAGFGPPLGQVCYWFPSPWILVDRRRIDFAWMDSFIVCAAEGDGLFLCPTNLKLLLAVLKPRSERVRPPCLLALAVSCSYVRDAWPFFFALLLVCLFCGFIRFRRVEAELSRQHSPIIASSTKTFSLKEARPRFRAPIIVEIKVQYVPRFFTVQGR